MAHRDMGKDLDLTATPKIILASISSYRGLSFLFLFLGALLGIGRGATNEPPRLTQGFSYHNDRIADGPWSIHIVKFDRSRSDFQLHTTLAKNTILGMSTLSEQVKSLPRELGRPLAAINGDYYHERAYEGDPKGLQIMQGELVSAPCGWSCFWIDAAGNPQMTTVLSRLKVTWPDGSTTPLGLNEERAGGAAVLYTPRLGASTRTSGGRELVLEHGGNGPWLPLQAARTYSARIRGIREEGNTTLSSNILVLSLAPELISKVPKVQLGMVLKISTSTEPELPEVTTAISGGPALVRDGKFVESSVPVLRHPRSAVGWNSKHMFLVQVDGRQRNLSVGMTLPELAAYMIKLGCDHALNLDGGGSATFWVYGQIMNSPSLGHERNMANALVLMQKEKD